MDFFEDHPVITFLSGVFISFLISLLFSPFYSELYLRVTGVILHVQFICLTIWVLHGVKERYVNWKINGSKYVLVADSGTFSSTLSNSSLIENLSPDASLSERVEHLESELKKLRTNFTEYSNKITKELKEIRQSIKQEEKSRANAIKELKEMIQSPLEIKKLKLVIWAFLWLIIGICLRTFSHEIANWYV